MKSNVKRVASSARLKGTPARRRLGFFWFLLICASAFSIIYINFKRNKTEEIIVLNVDVGNAPEIPEETAIYVNMQDEANAHLKTLEEVTDERTEKCFGDEIPGIAPFRKPEKVPLYAPIVDARSSDHCADVLNVDKVAWMILAKGNIHHHALWRQWFASAAGRVPKSSACDDTGRLNMSNTEAFVDGFYEDVCTKLKNPVIDFDDPIPYQILFSLYVHVPPGGEQHLDPFFRKYLISRQVKVEWGEHSMVYATRELLWFAFKDPRNTRFVLLSESDIPLYGPLQTYYQLQSEQKSRVDASEMLSTDKYRWNFRFLCGNPPIKETDWRKSSQWFTLIRYHAFQVLNDSGVYRSFERFCTSFFDDVHSWYRVCYSDEHYIPTLLGMVTNITTLYPTRGPSHVDFSKGGAHPYEYSPSNVTARLIYARLRVSHSCVRGLGPQKKWIRAINETFVNMFDESLPSCTIQKEHKDLLQSIQGSLWSCPLLARKFKIETQKAVIDLFGQYDEALAIIDERVCNSFKDWYNSFEQNQFKSRFFGNN